MGVVSQGTPKHVVNRFPVAKCDVFETRCLANGALVMFLHTADGRVLLRKRSYTKATRVKEVIDLIRRYGETAVTDWMEIRGPDEPYIVMRG